MRALGFYVALRHFSVYGGAGAFSLLDFSDVLGLAD